MRVLFSGRSLLCIGLCSLAFILNGASVSAADVDLTSAPMGDEISRNAQSIRIIHINDLQGDASPVGFYQQFGSEPVIVKGVYAESAVLKNLDPNALAHLFQDQVLEAYDRETGKPVEVPASEFLRDIRQGVSRYNVVDHPIAQSPFVGKLEVPSFLRDNWFVASGFDTDSRALSLTFSARGTFTPLHVDSYGMQAWMYLAYGKKNWILFAPEQVPLIFDSEFKDFYNPRKDSSSRFPLARSARKYVGTIEGGDLIFFPPGWAHQVITEEESFGVGGGIVNEFQMVESLKTWNIDRSYSISGPMDLKSLVETLAPSRIRTEWGRRNVTEALQRCEKWDLKNGS